MAVRITQFWSKSLNQPLRNDSFSRSLDWLQRHLLSHSGNILRTGRG